MITFKLKCGFILQDGKQAGNENDSKIKTVKP